MNMRNYLAGYVQGVSGKKMFLVRFQYGCEKYMTSNQLSILTLENISMTKEDKVPTIFVIP